VESLPRVTVTNDLDIDVLRSNVQPDALDEVLVHPGFKLAHPGSNVRRGHYDNVISTRRKRTTYHNVREGSLACGIAGAGGKLTSIAEPFMLALFSDVAPVPPF